MYRNLFVFCLIIVPLFSSCTRDAVIIPEPPVVITTNGAYILSEGGVNPGTSRLSFYSITKDSFYTNISPGILGLFPSGLVFKNNNLFLTEQGNFGSAGKIYKLDTNGAVITSQVVGTNPYSLTALNNKIYITNGPASNVSVVDMNSLSFIKSISVGVYPQEIIAIGNKVFVCNTSLYGGAQDSTVSVIDATTDNVVKTVIVQKDPSSLAITNDNKLLVGCPGQFGYVYLIDPDSYNKLDSFLSFDGFSKDIGVDSKSDDIFFISNSNNITKINLVSRVSFSIITNPSPSSSLFYGYNYESVNKKHYVCDAKNFTIAGNLNIYNEIGALEKIIYTIGIAPRRIVFKID